MSQMQLVLACLVAVMLVGCGEEPVVSGMRCETIGETRHQSPDWLICDGREWFYIKAISRHRTGGVSEEMGTWSTPPAPRVYRRTVVR